MEPDDLYGLPLEQFVAERGALAKALRAGKRRDEAAAIAALRKPSVAAWAVNQLVRTQADVVRELFAAGDELRAAQAALLAGTGDGRALRAAGQRERAAVDALVAAARGLLSSDGHDLSATIVERVGETLHAAALDEGARDHVRDGRLERELRHAGLGLGEGPGPAEQRPTSKAAPATDERDVRAPTTAGSDARSSATPTTDVPAPATAAGAAREQAAAARRAAREQAKRERAERERLEHERSEARKAARTAESAARRRAQRAAAALKVAEERRDRAAQALADADDALAAARREADAAQAAQRSARAEVERLS